MSQHINLFYTSNGPLTDKSPIIMLHGNGGNSSSFFYITDYFSKFRNTINIDTRGHGRTEKGNKPFTLNQFAEDLHDFLIEHNIPKAILLGFSDGGNIAILFALKYPHMVDALILNGANIFPEGLCEKDYKWIKDTYRKNKKLLRKHPYNEKFKDTLDMFSLMVNEPHISPSELEKIQINTLVLVGSHDAIKEEHSRLIANSIKGAKLSIVKGGHNIVKTNSEDYIKEVDSFLKEINK